VKIGKTLYPLLPVRQPFHGERGTTLVSPRGRAIRRSPARAYASGERSRVSGFSKNLQVEQDCLAVSAGDPRWEPVGKDFLLSPKEIETLWFGRTTVEICPLIDIFV